MNVKTVQNRLRRRAVTLRRGRQSGFTLLELLVVVAILAAIAGTATIALQDTDARAAAAAHVAMMDELNKGIRTYRVLQGNVLPDRFDSLLFSADGSATGAAVLPSADGEVLGFDTAALFTTDAAMVTAMTDVGMLPLRSISEAAAPPDSIAGQEDCDIDNIQALINSRRNAVVSGNIFLSAEANGCGVDYTPAAGDPVVVWTGGQERVLGAAAPEFDDATGPANGGNEIGAKVLMALGAGPSSNLFDASELGGMTSVPSYRHVAQDQYSRFILLFHIATVIDGDADGTADAFLSVDQVSLSAIVDGAGDTKEEELGEWDGTRNTI